VSWSRQHLDEKPTRTKPLARRTLPWRGAAGGVARVRLGHKEGGSCDPFTQEDAGRAPAYLHAVEQFAVHFGKSPDKLGPDDLRSYQAYLLVERKLAVASVVARVAALRFFFVRTLKRRDFREELPYPKSHRRLPTVPSLEEVARLIDGAGNLMQRALLMTLYGTGMRRTEL
jgi:integrase